MVLGAALLAVGTGLMGTIAYDTPFWLLFVYMGVIGLGIGMLMQNMVLVVQNTVDVSQMGAAQRGHRVLPQPRRRGRRRGPRSGPRGQRQERHRRRARRSRHPGRPGDR